MNARLESAGPHDCNTNRVVSLPLEKSGGQAISGTTSEVNAN
jgi:hypothetical protein